MKHDIRLVPDTPTGTPTAAGGALLKRLRALRSRRARLIQRRDELTAETLAAVTDALDEGVTVPQVARELGVSHQAVYQMLERSRR